MLDDAHNEGEETLTLSLSNASGGRIADGTATGTIKNRDPLPRALLARFGRTAAVHVVEHVEERIAAPREPGFRGRFAGRELRRGMERDFALSFLNRLGGLAGSPLGAGAHGPRSGAPAAGGASLGMGGLAGGRAQMAAVAMDGAWPGGSGGSMAAAGGLMSAGATGPMGGAAGLGGAGTMSGAAGPAGGLLQMGLGGSDSLTGSAFSMNRESRGGILSFWSRGARSHFAGREGTLGLSGDVSTTMFGLDYAKGPIVGGVVAVAQPGPRGVRRGGRGPGALLGGGPLPVAGLQGDRPHHGVGRGRLRWRRAAVDARQRPGAGVGPVDGDGGGGHARRAGRGRRERLRAGVKADALWVGTAIDGVDGPAGRLAATEAAVTRFRTGLEGSRGYTLAGRLSLTPSVEVGLRHDGGDAETGAGMDVGAGLIVSDASTGLAVDVRVRTLLVHQAEGFSERGMALSVSYNPTPSTPLGFNARVAAVVGRAGGERGRGAVGPGDDGRDGPRQLRAGQPAGRRGRLRAAGGEPSSGDAAGRLLHLGVRPGLPGRLRARGARPGEPELRAGRRCAAPGEPDGGRHRQRRPRSGAAHSAVLVEYAAASTLAVSGPSRPSATTPSSC